jgi:hypothetical protein
MQVLGIAASSSAPGLSEQPAMSSQSSRPEPYSAFTPNGGGMSLFVTILTVLAAMIGVVALARLTVGDEFFSMRWLH